MLYNYLLIIHRNDRYTGYTDCTSSPRLTCTPCPFLFIILSFIKLIAENTSFFSFVFLKLISFGIFIKTSCLLVLIIMYNIYTLSTALAPEEQITRHQAASHSSFTLPRLIHTYLTYNLTITTFSPHLALHNTLIH